MDHTRCLLREADPLPRPGWTDADIAQSSTARKASRSSCALCARYNAHPDTNRFLSDRSRTQRLTSTDRQHHSSGERSETTWPPILFRPGSKPLDSSPPTRRAIFEPTYTRATRQSLLAGVTRAGDIMGAGHTLGNARAWCGQHRALLGARTQQGGAFMTFKEEALSGRSRSMNNELCRRFALDKASSSCSSSTGGLELNELAMNNML